MSLVLVDRPRPEVAVITMNRPDRLNAMSIDLVNELYDALCAAGEDNACRVVVLTGAGRAFSSGLDLKDYGVVPNIDGLQVGQIAQRSMRTYSRLVPLIRHLPQPVVAAVNGAAFGGGMCLTLACELRIASSAAVPYLPGGFVAGSRSRSFSIRPAMADRICEFSAYGVAMTKDILWVNLETTSLESAIEIEDRNQLMLGFTENLPEAIRAFDEGRRPVYTDEPRRGMFLP